MNTNIPTPDFISHNWQPISSALLEDGFVTVEWSDGVSLKAYSLWLAENADGYGLEPLSRESMLEPRTLPDPRDLTACNVGANGELQITWKDGRENIIHPGWLRYVAEGRLTPSASLPVFRSWDTNDLTEPPSASYSDFDDEKLKRWLSLLITYGTARLSETPQREDFIESFASGIGCIRSSNFGYVFNSLENSYEIELEQISLFHDFLII